MPITVAHKVIYIKADDDAQDYRGAIGEARGTASVMEIMPVHWNSEHVVVLNLSSDELVKWVSAGASSISSGTLAFGNGNNVTFGMDKGTITASVPATSVLTATGDLSMSVNGATISLGFVSGQAAGATQSFFNPQDGMVQVAGQHGQGTLHIQPMLAPNVQFDRLCMPMAFSNATNSSGSQTLSVWAGVYTRNASTLSLASSTSYSAAVTASGTQGAYSSYGGVRLVTIGSTNTLTEGQYWLGIVSRTTSGGANASFSQMVVSQVNSSYSGIWGQTSNASHQSILGLGYYSASTAGMPNSIAFADVRGNSSMAQREPVVYFVSGTV